MILSTHITEKSFGSKSLFSNISFSIQAGEKVGLIGRNGVGKSTLFNILIGRDTDFTGETVLRRGATLVATDQEYNHVGDISVMEYILSGLPEYLELSKTINDFTAKQNPKMREITAYSNALERFNQKEYHFVEKQVAEEMKNFQLSGYESRQFATLSGGEKRLAEVVKIMHSKADLALIDEPTNFMDYVAKAKFINWLQSAPEAVIVITHDRDVLHEVDRIIEIKDGAAVVYKGNYNSYLAQNSTRTTTDMHGYEVVQRQIENLKKQLSWARARKPNWHGTADKRNPFMVMEERYLRELAALQAVAKPSFWIDKSSASELNYKDAARYQKYKAKNVRIGLKSADSKSQKTIIKAENLSIGYDRPLFSGKNFQLAESGTLEIRGRNGAGKTTLIKAILSAANPNNSNPAETHPTIFTGFVTCDPRARIGIYHQEVDRKYFPLPLHQAIERLYLDQHLNISETKIRQLLADYLFTEQDRITAVAKLSGGQKARFQIISMLSCDPQLLILDEPTSHLDLPSIEELETALLNYSGAILYISHDNYFRTTLGGDLLEI
jgi:ATPase subunit of ABC transporter with duplicated ATPase domains